MSPLFGHGRPRVKDPEVVLSDLAVADVFAQADWYELRSDYKLAIRWERAVTSTVLRLVRMPQSGAPCRFKSELLRDIRRLPVTGFPQVIFYRFRDNQIHVLRVLHGARDLERLFAE